MDKDNRHSLDTLVVHNSRRENPDKALTPPIAMTSTFYFNSVQDAQKAFKFETEDYVYSRGNNPSQRLFEEKMAILEGGNAACAFGSGMGAVSSVMLSLLKPGDKALLHKTLYGSSFSFARTLLTQQGIEVVFIDMTDLDRVKENIDSRTKMIYFESPSNPNLEIVDIEQVCKIAGQFGSKVVVDNTFMSPYLQNPLSLGAYVVLHSATKYISGHGDVIAGVAVSKDADYIARLKFGYMCEYGSVLSPFNAWLLLRGLKTLHVRMQRHEENTKKVVEYLESDPRFRNLNHPSLAKHPGHDTAKKQMRGFGSLVTFEIGDSMQEAVRFVDSLKLFRIAVSLGDTESLVEIPSQMTHFGYSAEELEKAGIAENMIRISIGIEDYNDLIKDLRQAADCI